MRKGPFCLIDAQEFPVCLSGKMKSVFCFRDARVSNVEKRSLPGMTTQANKLQGFLKQR
jgi:hypothetical protein